MAVHLVKLCVGIDSLAALAALQPQRQAEAAARGFAGVLHLTKRRPRRADELCAGGSLYWVIKGFIRARQPVIDVIEVAVGRDGCPGCAILLGQPLIPVQPVPRKAFQGWRYLAPAAAPPDLPAIAGSIVSGEVGEDSSGAGADDSGAAQALPAALAAELQELGVW